MSIYRKVHLSVKRTHLQHLGVFVNLCSVTEGSKRHSAFSCRRCSGDLTLLPPLIAAVKVFRKRSRWPTEAHSFGLCRSNSLGLPLFDIGAFILRNKAQNLQNNITQKCSHQVFATAGIQ